MSKINFNRVIQMLKKIIILLVLLPVSSSWALELTATSLFSSVFELNPAVAGVIKSIQVTPGQQVKKGDVLIEMDDTPYISRLNRARAIESALLPEVNVSEVEYERAQELYDRDSLSQIALQNAENKYLKAQGLYQAARSDLELREYELSRTKLRAPEDAQVLDLRIKVGRYLDPGVNNSPIITLADTRKITAVARLKADQWKSTLINKKAAIKFRGKSFKGIVRSIGLINLDNLSKKKEYGLYVDFISNTDIPEKMPLTVTIK